MHLEVDSTIGIARVSEMHLPFRGSVQARQSVLKGSVTGDLADSAQV